ncbi:MAG: hypothetical protein WC582_00945 [Patescibacteria group bacterium]
MTLENYLDIISIIILGLTGYIIYLYTKAAQETNSIRLRPVLNLYLRGEGGNEYFALRNIGETTAYNIQVHPIEIEGYTYEFTFKQSNFILESNGDEKRIFFPTRKMPNGGIQGTNMIWLKQHLVLKQLTDEAFQAVAKLYLSFLINYNNINGEKFYSVFKLYLDAPISDDLVIEFIRSETGECKMEEAKDICRAQNRLN